MPPPETTYSLLVIDDDKIFCDTVKDTLQSENLDVLTAHSKQDGLAVCTRRKIDVVLLDQKLPDGEGHLLCPAILSSNDETRIIFITAYPSFDNAVRAIKAGAHDYLSKPFELEELRLVIQQAINVMELERVKRVESYRIRKEKDDTVLIGDFGKGMNIRDLIDLAASVASPVLITGETGTGKNVVARAIHFNAPFKEKPFISVNCTALPETLIEDELFGHEKGAFTDARTTRKGLFEIAQGGTLYLDEIGDMPQHLQAKLLGVLDDKKIRRLGGQSFIPVNVRIIAATNSSPEQRILEKRFRQDLYYRLSVLRIHLPPLRERPEDIPLLCEFFIRQLAPVREQRSAPLTLPDREMARLLKYPWPGNVRELKNIIERSILLHGHSLRPSELIEYRPLPVKMESDAPVPSPSPLFPSQENPKTLAQVEEEYIQQVMRTHSYNLTHSARALGISLSTLKRKVKQFDLPRSAA